MAITGSPWKTMMILAGAVLIAAATVVTGQTPSPGNSSSCIGSLSVCSSSLKQDNVTKDCCDALKKTVETQLSCLCSLFTNKQLLSTFNITPDKALLFPLRCGLSADPNLCTSSTQAPLPPPAAPSSGTPNGQKNNAAKLTGTGLVGLVLISINMMFN